MKEFVIGFLFDKRFRDVVMILKNRPDWQVGFLNGVGGHVEPGELPSEAMRREFKEEAGLDIISWFHIASVICPERRLHYYRAIGDVLKVKQKTDEQIVVINTDLIYSLHKVMPPSDWILRMAFDTAMCFPAIFNYSADKKTMRDERGRAIS